MLQIVFLACGIITGEPICIEKKLPGGMTMQSCHAGRIKSAFEWMRQSSHPFTKWHSGAVICERGMMDV